MSNKIAINNETLISLLNFGILSRNYLLMNVHFKENVIPVFFLMTMHKLMLALSINCLD